MAAAVENWSEIEISDAEVGEIIEEAGGDPRQAIKKICCTILPSWPSTRRPAFRSVSCGGVCFPGMTLAESLPSRRA